MQHYYDGDGQYRGRSVNAVASGGWRALGALITLALVAWLFFWPAVQIGGFLGWTLTGFWWILLLLVFLFIGYLAVRRDGKQQKRQDPGHYQPRHAGPAVKAGPGPRDWEPDQYGGWQPGDWQPGDWQQGARHF